MSNASHKKKQSSFRRTAHRVEAATHAQKAQKKTRKNTLSRARLADMTAELDGRYAETVYQSSEVQHAGSWQEMSRPQMKSSEDSVTSLAEVLDAL